MQRLSPRGRVRDILASLAVAALAAGAAVGMAVALGAPGSETVRTSTPPGRFDDDVAADPALQDCGHVTLVPGEGGPTSQGQCLVDAVTQGRRSRLTVTSHTTEGDPITSYLESWTDGQVAVHTDTRADAFGPRRITYELCRGPQNRGVITFSLCAGEPATVDTLPW